MKLLVLRVSWMQNIRKSDILENINYSIVDRYLFETAPNDS